MLKVGTRSVLQRGHTVGVSPEGARPMKRRTRCATTWSGNERARGDERIELGFACLQESSRMMSSPEHSGDERKARRRASSHCLVKER